MTRPSVHRVPPGLPGHPPSGGPATDPYARLLEERIVLLGTRIDEASANDVIARLLHLEHRDPDREVSLHVNSPGGSFHAMSAVYDTLRHLACDVATVCLGRAEGTAVPLLAAGTPGRRSVLPGARLVLRRPSPPGPLGGRVDDLAARAEELARAGSRMADMLVRHTGRTPEQVRSDLERDTVLDARAAVDRGLADRIVPGRGGRPAADAG